MRLLSWYKNRAFLRPKSYQVHFSVPLSKVQTAGWLLLPYPTSTDYQQVTALQLKATGQVQQHDLFYLIEQPNAAELTYRVTVAPRQLDLSTAGQLTLADYTNPLDGKLYCQPDQSIQSDHPVIIERARALQAQQTNVLALLQRLYDHTIETLRYGDPIPGLYSTTAALERSCVDCGGFSTYLAALSRACRIPSRLVSGFWAGHKRNEMHAWLECLLPNGQWLALDPAVDWLRRAGRSHTIGGFNQLGSDRIVMNTGSHHTVRCFGSELTLAIIQTPVLLKPNGEIEYLNHYRLTTT